MPAVKSEIDEAEKEGVKIHILAAPVKVLTKGGRVAGLQCVRMELGEPDESGRRRPMPIAGSAFEVKVDDVIIAIGQAVDKSRLPAGLEYTTWGTVAADPVTLQTNIDGVFAGGDAVAGPADAIRAIAAGKETAISIDRYLRKVDLKEGRPTPFKRAGEVSKAGVEKEARAAMPLLEVKKRKGFAEVEIGLDEKTAVEEANRCLSCGVCSECLECIKACEVQAINHEMVDKIEEIEVGNIILTTGFNLFDAARIPKYGYGKLNNVITSLEFERMVNASGPTGGDIILKDGTHPKSVAIIHCVGSRDKEYHEYCSRVCCMYSMKFSHLIKEHVPGAKVYEFFVDIRAFGKGYEEFYNRVVDEGTAFIESRPSGVIAEDGKLVVQYELNGTSKGQPVDMVVLSVALEAQKDTGEVGRLFSISRSADGFFLERHPKLDPVATMTDGIFIAGCCQGPKDIPDTVAQAAAAAARVMAMISKGKVEIEAATAVIDEEKCSGCKVCSFLCPYGAISFDEEKLVCRVNAALCKGCGACVGGCTSDAISLSHFTNEQILAQMEGALG
jgi:heterodisulfide reductase subunit A